MRVPRKLELQHVTHDKFACEKRQKHEVSYAAQTLEQTMIQISQVAHTSCRRPGCRNCGRWWSAAAWPVAGAGAHAPHQSSSYSDSSPGPHGRTPSLQRCCLSIAKEGAFVLDASFIAQNGLLARGAEIRKFEWWGMRQERGKRCRRAGKWQVCSL